MDITAFVIDNEKTLRIGVFVGMLLIMATWETLSPRRVLSVSRLYRWVNNLGLVFLNTYILRILFPAAAVGVTVTAQAKEWGLFNNIEVPIWLSVIATIVILDFVIYLQHVMVHAIPALWRLHRVHHADPDFDVTTGARFHPLEIILSMLIKFTAIVLLGPPVIAVIVFEIILNAMAMFNHSNIKLPLAIDSMLRLVVVTPDVHRVHHSVNDNEANSNFGFSLVWWDKLFGTYIKQPEAGHSNMKIGIHRFHDSKDIVRLDGLLTLPFKGKITSYSINRRNWDSNED